MMTRQKWQRLFRRWAPHAGAGIVLAVLLTWERPVYDAIRMFRNPFLDLLTHLIAHLRGAVFPALVGLLLVGWGALRSRTKIWRAGTALLLSAALAGAAVAVLKPTFARPGPGGPWKPKPGESWIGARYGRFPSSHAAVLFGSATALAAFLPVTAPAGYTVAALVCHERVYDATHFPSDIFAGAWLGIVVARFVLDRLRRRDGWKSDMAPSWRVRRVQRRRSGRTWSVPGEAEALRSVDSA
jgi:membrane-associated phospholipid phosphatase